MARTPRNKEFSEILQVHTARYPLMEPRDYGKLAHQSEFGPEHLITDLDRALASILAERGTASALGAPRSMENIGGGLCRFPILRSLTDEGAELLARLLVLTARNTHGTMEGLEEKLALLRTLNIPGMGKWLEEWKQAGYPPVRHSEGFRAAYHPHYRLLKTQYAGFFPALLEIRAVAREKSPAVIAIDGRCGSGKTSLASLIAALLPCNIVHMDDFYLPPEKRMPDWERVPAGNIDLERFLTEVLRPARDGKAILHRPYDCRTGEYGPARALPEHPLTIVEGSYSHHPLLSGQYDRRIFLTCSGTEQERRLRLREGGCFPAFQARWMPLEEHYFSSCAIEQNSDLVIDTSEFFQSVFTLPEMN